MNIRFVVRQIGLLMLVLSLSILAVACQGAVQWFRDAAGSDLAATKALLWTVAIGAALGTMFWFAGRGGDSRLGRREALLLVAVIWLFGAAVAGLPFRLWALTAMADSPGHPFHSFVDCYFEAMSGLTTTGATVLGHAGHMIRDLPEGLLLWRALTHWLGGLGIVVLFVAVLPTLGVSGKKLFQIEAPGPKAPGVRPRIGETARTLWIIYMGLTVAEIISLWVAGSSLFDATCHTFATLGTGGFSTQDSSIGGQNLTSQIIILLFMVAAGVNFGLYHQMIHGHFRRAWSDPELRLYLGILVVSCIVVIAAIAHQPIATTQSPETPLDPQWGSAAVHGAFQVVAIQTGTGFCTADFNGWGFVAQAVLVTLMFVGASSGSTGGGIKVIRVLIAFKVMIYEIERVFRPSVVRTVKVGKMKVDDDLKLATLVYIMSIAVLFLLGAVIIMILERNNPFLAGQGIDFTTAATASAATLNNIGPGLSRVGAIENYGWFSASGKLVLSMLMVLGRLEMYAILVLFVPRFWKGQ